MATHGFFYDKTAKQKIGDKSPESVRFSPVNIIVKRSIHVCSEISLAAQRVEQFTWFEIYLFACYQFDIISHVSEALYCVRACRSK